MSREYREKNRIEMDVVTSPEMRFFCSRPGRVDGDGNPLYTTEQSHKKECDVNEIIKKYDRTGLINHVAKFEAKFGDLRGVDFKNAMDLVTRSQAMFDGLPSEIRSRFNNSPQFLLQFMEDPKNRPEAIELGLISPEWTEDTDGLGEHIKDEKERKKKSEQKETKNKEESKEKTA